MNYYKIAWIFIFIMFFCSFNGCKGCRKKTAEDVSNQPISTNPTGENAPNPGSESSMESNLSSKVETGDMNDMSSLSDRKTRSATWPSKEDSDQTPVAIRKPEISETEESKQNPLKSEVQVALPKNSNLPDIQKEISAPKSIPSLKTEDGFHDDYQPLVNTKSPVDSKSPIRTDSPVNTESPVKENQPVRKIPTRGIPLGLLPRTVLSFGTTILSLTLKVDGVELETDQTSPVSESKPVEENKLKNQVTETSDSNKPTDLKEENKVEIKPEPSNENSRQPVQNNLEHPQIDGPPQDHQPNYRQGPPQRDHSYWDSVRSGDDLEQPKESKQTKPDDQVEKSERRNLRFNFRYAPWKDVIEWFADQAELSLQADNVPTGSLNLTDNNFYTPSEALDILNSYLLFKEYTIIRKGKSMFVIYLPDGIPPNLLEPISSAELDNRGKYELCRCVFNLTRTTPDVIQLEAEKLLGPQGSIVVLPKSQQIVVTETAGTLRAIREIIKKVDDPDDLAGGSIHIVEMKNLSADEALGIMRKLLAIEESDQSLRTAVDISGTKIWMSGRGDMIERAKEIIKTIDNSFESKDVVLEGQPQFEVYNVGTADPQAVLSVLQTLLAGTPDVRLSIDTKTGGIAALGRPANHATIRETIRQMQLNVPTVEVIPLKRLSPVSAVESIKKFFATSSVSNSSSTSTTNKQESGVPDPTVEADVSARQIIVRGTKSQITDIRNLLEKLGEDGTGGVLRSQETIRTIPLSPSATALVLDQLKEIWPKLEQSEIKVVTPSAIVPMRSTSDLMPKNDSAPKQEQPQKSKLDQLIDKTFQVDPSSKTNIPTTFRRSFSKVRFLPVQLTQIQEIAGEDDRQPKYQPIHADDSTTSSLNSNETEELKRQLAELQKKLDILLSDDLKQTKTSVPTISKTEITQAVQATNASTETLKRNAPVVVSSGPNGLMISSENPEALDKLEELIRMLSDETVLGKTSLVVYYLKNSTAEVVAQTLQTLMGTSSTTTFGVSGSGSIDTSPNFENEQRAALLGMLQIGNSIEKTGPLSISADSRLNALLIQANPVDHKTIERLLPILDQEEIPGGEIKKKAKPRLIPLQNMRAEDAQTSVEKIFATRIQSGSGTTGTVQQSGGNRSNNRQQGQQNNMPMMMPGMPPGMPGGPGMMLQQMMSRMGGQSSSTAKEQEATMTLGVDSRSNSLIVSAPESLFLEVEAFVKELDHYAAQTETVVQVVQLKEISPDLAKQTIANLAGDSVKFSTSQSSAQTTGNQRSGGFSGGFGTNRSGFGGGGLGTNRGGFGNTGGNNNPFMNMMRQGGFGGGGFGGQQGFGGFGNQRR